MYLHWLIGKVVGWGGTVPFYLVDLAAVVGLGAALACWSRGRLGGALPGLVGYLAFLGFYLGADYDMVAERDWHTPLLAGLGLMAAEGWRGRAGRAWLAVALAAALTIRPHAILFLPAAASAVVEGSERGRAWRALGEWALMLVGAVVVGSAPVWLSGIADDLVVGLRTALYGGPYSKATQGSITEVFLGQLRDGRTVAVGLALLATAVVGPVALREPSRTWALAMVGALMYRPLHPVSHMYLAIPAELLEAVSLSLPVAWLAGAERINRPFRLLATLLVLYLVMTELPRFFLPQESLRALGPLARGEPPPRPPSGCRQFFHVEPERSNYAWSREYLPTLRYLRRATGPDTIVANVLRQLPFPPINGPTGRPSPFLADSGLCWMWLVDQDLDAEFAAQLEHAADIDPRSVVVWVPDESDVAGRMVLPKLADAIRRRYRPEARFGRIEVWRARGEDDK